jgi:hypothetical protein
MTAQNKQKRRRTMLHLLIKHAYGKYVVVVNRRLTKATRNYYYSDNLEDAVSYKCDYSVLESHCKQYNNGRTDGKKMVITDNEGIYEILEQEN